MIHEILLKSIEVFIGLGSGFIVGSGFVAFLTVLGIIPRLVQLSKSVKSLILFQNSVILGAMLGNYFTFSNLLIGLPPFSLTILGLFQGIFVGMLAAALTEVLNVFPLLMKRLGIERELMWLLMAIVIGKIIGSLFHWIIFVDIV